MPANIKHRIAEKVNIFCAEEVICESSVGTNVVSAVINNLAQRKTKDARAIPKAIQNNIATIKAPKISPLIKAGIGPKKNVVHENPTGAFLIIPVFGCSIISFIYRGVLFALVVCGVFPSLGFAIGFKVFAVCVIIKFIAW
jgi:hypothetical protein